MLQLLRRFRNWLFKILKVRRGFAFSNDPLQFGGWCAHKDTMLISPNSYRLMGRVIAIFENHVTIDFEHLGIIATVPKKTYRPVIDIHY